MAKRLSLHCMACAATLWASTAAAQQSNEADYDYDAAVEDLPIESEVYEEPLTFKLYNGGIFNFYGQFNPAYQSFDDGDVTTRNIVDNGNWNSRVGFTIIQPVDEGQCPRPFRDRPWPAQQRTRLAGFHTGMDRLAANRFALV